MKTLCGEACTGASRIPCAWTCGFLSSFAFRTILFVLNLVILASLDWQVMPHTQGACDYERAVESRAWLLSRLYTVPRRVAPLGPTRVTGHRHRDPQFNCPLSTWA